MDKALKEVQEEAILILDHYFTRRDLNGEFKTLIQLFFRQQRPVLEKYGFKKELEDNLSRSMKKQELLELCAIPFLHLELFNAFYDSLPSVHRNLMDLLIWEEQLLLTEIEERLEEPIQQLHRDQQRPGFYHYRGGATTVMGFFKQQNLYNTWSSYNPKYILLLPRDLRGLLAQYYELPPEAEWIPIDQPEATAWVYDSGEVDIMIELPRLQAYEAQQLIRKTTKNRVMASTLSKMQRQLNLKPFFPKAKDKKLKFTRTALLAGMMVGAYKSKLETNRLEFLYRLLTKDWTEYIYSMPMVLNFIKGINKIDNIQLKSVESTLFQLFQSMPIESWLSFDNFEKYISYHFLDLKPIDSYYTREKLYYEDILLPDFDSPFRTNQQIDQGYYRRGIYIPFLKGIIFNFAALGLVDIAYDEPDTSHLGETYFSPYDGLRYFRINGLGAYIFGQRDSYEPKAEAEATSYLLSSANLMLIAAKYDEDVNLLVEPFMEQVAPNRFRTNAAIFLKDCKSQRDLRQKIQLFKKTIQADLPPNWQAFFSELEQKINPLKSVEQVRVFQIPEEQKDLQQLVIRDPVLKKLVYKAEGFHLLVLQKNYAAFRKRLLTFGYLLS